MKLLTPGNLNRHKAALMTINYEKMNEIKAKDLENLLWQAFWSYSEELGLNESEAKKESMLKLAHRIIPEYAASAMEYDLAYDYPLFQLFILSMLSEENFLKVPEVTEVMRIEGPDDNAKLARIVMEFNKKGITWEPC